MKASTLEDLRDFWIHSQKWPKEQDGYVFLASAVLQVGRVIMRGSWNDFDPAMTFGVRSKLYAPYRLPRDRYPEMNDEEFTGFAEEYDRRWEEAHQPAFRVDAVVEWLVERFANGSIKTGTRPYDFGDVSPVPVSVWKAEREVYGPRFSSCQMRVEPTVASDLVPAPRIFVEKKGLEDAINEWEARAILIARDEVEDDKDQPSPIERARLWLRNKIKDDPDRELEENRRDKLQAAATERFGITRNSFRTKVWPVETDGCLDNWRASRKEITGGRL